MKTVMKGFSRVAWGLAVLSLAFSAAAADKAVKDDKAPMRRLQQQLRAIEQEKAQLAQQKADAEGQLKEAQGRAAEGQRRAESASQRNLALAKAVEALKVKHDSALAESQARIAEGKAENAALTTRLADSERRLAEQRLAYDAEKQQWQTLQAKSSAAMAGCRARNDRMYKLGHELLDKYQNKSCFTSALQGEPFTGLKRAQIEKMVEDEREKLDKEQLVAPVADHDPPPR